MNNSIFKSILREAGYNHGASKEKIKQFIKGPVAKWFNQYGFKVILENEELPWFPPEEWHEENCVVKAVIKPKKTSGTYKVSFDFSNLYHDYSTSVSSSRILPYKVLGKEWDGWSSVRDYEQKDAIKVRGQYIYKMEAEAANSGLEVKFEAKDKDYSSSADFDFIARDISGSDSYKTQYEGFDGATWIKESEDLVASTFELAPLENYTTKNEKADVHYYLYTKNPEAIALVKITSEVNSRPSYSDSDDVGKGYLEIVWAPTDDYRRSNDEEIQRWHFQQADCPDPETIIQIIRGK